jgi:hypothetical protein
MTNNLTGQFVTVYTDGGWKASGLVHLDKKDRMGLADDQGNIYIILKAKICMIQMSSEVKENKDFQDQEKSPEYNLPQSRGATRSREAYYETEENKVGVGNQYGSLIPEDLLEEGEASKYGSDDFAVSWGGSSRGKIEVKVDSTEEA